ncbi:hypothetical protein LCGC14_1050030 [marine sediment metagenome]|uniref:Uncharacterized protein n=1 Tax=marine sediment metagenome TaxID=412755 RepID=A0A0F9NAY5_9ZZZZ
MSKIFKISLESARRELFRWWLQKIEQGIPDEEALFWTIYIDMEIY